MFTISTLWTLVSACGALLLVRALLESDLKQSPNSLVWVAECWIEAPRSESFILYRRGFKSAKAAERSARRRAWLLDVLFHNRHRAEASCSWRDRTSPAFDIKWGVRLATCEESAKDIVRIWAPTLPEGPAVAAETAGCRRRRRISRSGV